MALLRDSVILAPILMVSLALVHPAAALHAQIVINEVAASNDQTLLDDEADSPDWIELANTGTSLISLVGFGLSDRPEQSERWTLPDISLGPGEHLLVWCSGKNRTEPVAETTSLELQLEGELVPDGAAWKWLTASTSDPALPTGWTEVNFDDADWPADPTPIGFHHPALETSISDEFRAVLLRHKFVVAETRTLPNLFLEIDFDDGFVAYLNGVRVLSKNFSANKEPDFASTVGRVHDAGVPMRFDLSTHLAELRTGENVLALIALNSPTPRGHPRDDLLIDPQLGSIPPALHADFSLNRDGGETVVLTDPTGTAVDFVALPPQTQDRTYGRFPDGTGDFVYLLLPTPRAPNDSHVSDTPLPSPSPVLITPAAGFTREPPLVEVLVDLPFDDYEVRYTTNGSLPTATSTLYGGPVRFTEDVVVRAAAFVDGRLATRVATSTYFGLVPENSRLHLPVMAISMNAADFAYVHGNDAGRGRAFERPARLELFTESGEPATALGMGLRLHGGAGRGGDFATKKAYRVYFRNTYGGDRLEFPLFNDSPVTTFSRLVLRSNFNDAFRVATARAALIRDQAIRDLFGDMGGVISHGTWYNLFVNMEYRGIYNVVERMDESFFRAYFPAEEAWDVIKTGSEVLEGDSTAWNELTAFAADTDVQEESLYDAVAQRVDLANFTSYMLVNIWAQNVDWPGNNWYAARPRRDDGRWIFLSWDAEFGLGLSPQGFRHDTLRHVLDRPESRIANLLITLLKSPRYREFFLEHMEAALAGPLAAENVLAHIDRLASTIAPDMEEELRRVGTPIEAWENDIEDIRTFARMRGDVLRDIILTSGEFPDERPRFFRGDVDGDGRRNLRDALFLAGFLTGRFEADCEDALDVDDSGTIELTDVLFLANHLFVRGAPTPVTPFRACGVDPSDDPFRCDASPEVCEE